MFEGKRDYQCTPTMEALQQRANLLKGLRAFFDQRGFIEVETPLLSHDIVIDQHLHPVAIDKHIVTGASRDAGTKLWLQTSPEFAMKRMLVSGAKAIYQIGKAFRQGESGQRHNPEFTMLEWYRVGDDYQAGMTLLEELILSILDTKPATRITYRDAFLSYAGIDPFLATKDELAILGGGSPSDARDELLNLVLARFVEPRLGLEGPELLYDYPASQAALAQVRLSEEFPVAERFEIYLDGVELANGYHELTDPDELRLRNEANNAKRVADGNMPLPSESRLLDAMEAGLPSCSGTALGVDRLAMLALKANSISEVISFPLDRA